MYLDTHGVVFLHGGLLDQFTPAGLHLLEVEPLYISPMVRLELQYLHEIKRIRYTPTQIIEDLERDIDLTVRDMGFHRVILAAQNIGWTRDPFDRIIVAQAELDGQRLLSKDEVMAANSPVVIW